MPYIGNPAVVGDSANTFKLLDDISSFTVTFDATDSDVVSIANNTLTFNDQYKSVNLKPRNMFRMFLQLFLSSYA